MSKTLYSGTYIVTEEVNDFVTVGSILKGNFEKVVVAFNSLTEKLGNKLLKFQVMGMKFL